MLAATIGLLGPLTGFPSAPSVGAAGAGLPSTGIRLRLRFSSLAAGLGRVSLLIGNSIFPKILGPSNFSALIFSMVGGASSSTFGAAATGSGTAGASSATFFLSVLAAGFSTSCAGASSVFFFAAFLGRVEESMADKSILLITFGASISGATVFSTSGAFTSGVGAGATGASTTGSSLRTFLSSFLAKERSSSSLFFLGSACAATLGIST